MLVTDLNYSAASWKNIRQPPCLGKSNGQEEWCAGLEPSGYQLEKNTTHIIRKVQLKRSIWALYNPFTHTSIFKTLSPFMRISRKICFSQATDSLRKQQLKSVIHILSLSLQGFLFLPLSTKLTAMQGFAFMIEHCREQRADCQLSVLSQNHKNSWVGKNLWRSCGPRPL